MGFEELVKIVLIGLCTTCLCLVLKGYKSEFAFYAGLAGGVILLFMLLGYVEKAIAVVRAFTDMLHSDFPYFVIAVKVIGVVYLVEFGAQLCKDAGEQAIAMKIETGGKLAIFLLSLPVLGFIVDLIKTLLA